MPVPIVLRKIRSGLSLLRHEDPCGQLSRRAGENLRALRLRFYRDRPMFYQHSNGFPFVVVPEAPETREIYHHAQNYERTESAVIGRWLLPGDFAIDCGANVGLITALMAYRVGPEGCVWAIEASPSTAEKLAAVLTALAMPQISIRMHAVSDQAGAVFFSDDASSSESNAIRTSAEYEGRTCVLAESMSLEELVASAVPRTPALIKMDIEGAEPLAFRGWPSLSRVPDPPLFVFEVYPRGLVRLGMTPGDNFSAMPLDRYRLWHLNASWPNSWPDFPRGVPFALEDPFTHPWPMHSNVVAVPREGAFAPRSSRLRELLPPHDGRWE